MIAGLAAMDPARIGPVALATSRQDLDTLYKAISERYFLPVEDMADTQGGSSA